MKVPFVFCPYRAALFLLSLSTSAPALTVPVAKDTFSGSKGTIAAASGKGVTLAVNAKQTGLIAFDLNDTAVVPEAILATNVQSATLRLYVVSSNAPANGGTVTVHTVTSTWQETFTGAAQPLPTFDATPVATISAAELKAKTFVNVPLTDAIVTALQNGNINGFALRTSDAKTKVTFASKEGPAAGYSTELEIVANTGLDGAGNISANNLTLSGNLQAAGATFTGLFRVSTAFAVEAHPANNPGDPDTNIFVGKQAGLTNSTGQLNTFIGSYSGVFNTVGNNNSFFGANAGRATTTGDNNSFFGTGAGFTNTTGASNTSVGSSAGFMNDTGIANTFLGVNAGRNSSTGSQNTCVGGGSGLSLMTESKNTFLGDSSGGAPGITNSTALGQGASVTISNAVVLGNNCSVGIGTSAPNSTLQVAGSLSLPVRSSGQNVQTLTSSDYVLISTAGGATVVLPVMSTGIAGRVYVVKNRGNSAITLGSPIPNETIDGAATLSIPAGTAAQVISNGSVWFKIN